jgi:hypothetical protein
LKALSNYCQFCEQREKLKVAYLSNEERDRLRSLQHARAGLPTEAEMEAAANQRRREYSERLLESLLAK